MVIVEPTSPNSQKWTSRAKRKITGAALEPAEKNSLLAMRKTLLTALSDNDAGKLETLFKKLNTNKQRHLFLQDKTNIDAIEGFLAGEDQDPQAKSIVLGVLKDYVQYDSQLLGTKADPRYQSFESLVAFLQDETTENTEMLAANLGYTYTDKNDENVQISTASAQDQTRDFFKGLGASDDRVLNLVYNLAENSSLKEQMAQVEETLFNDIGESSRIFQEGSSNVEALQEHVIQKYKDTYKLLKSRKAKKFTPIKLDIAKAQKFFPHTPIAKLDEALDDKFGAPNASGEWQVFSFDTFLEKLINPSFESRKEAVESIFNAYDILEADKLEASKANDTNGYKALEKQQNDLLNLLKDESVIGTEGVALIEKTLTNKDIMAKMLPRVLVTFTGILNTSSQASVARLVQVFEKEKDSSFGLSTESLTHVKSLEDLEKEITKREKATKDGVSAKGKTILTALGVELPELKKVQDLKSAFAEFHKDTMSVIDELTNNNYEEVIEHELGTAALAAVKADIASLGDLENPGSTAKSSVFKYAYAEFLAQHETEIRDLMASSNSPLKGDFDDFIDLTDKLDYSHADQTVLNNGQMKDAFNELLNLDRTSGNELLRSLDADKFSSAFTVNSLSIDEGTDLIQKVLDTDASDRASKQGNSESVLLSILQDSTRDSLTTRATGLAVLLEKINSDPKASDEAKEKARSYITGKLKDHSSISAEDFISRIGSEPVDYKRIVKHRDLNSWLALNRNELLTKLVPAVNSEFSDLLGKVFPVNQADLLEELMTPVAANIADLALNTDFKEGVTEEQELKLKAMGISATTLSQLEKSYDANGDFDPAALFMHNEHSEEFNFTSLVKQFIKSIEKFFNQAKMDIA